MHISEYVKTARSMLAEMAMKPQAAWRVIRTEFKFRALLMSLHSSGYTCNTLSGVLPCSFRRSLAKSNRNLSSTIPKRIRVASFDFCKFLPSPHLNLSRSRSALVAAGISSVHEVAAVFIGSKGCVVSLQCLDRGDPIDICSGSSLL